MFKKTEKHMTNHTPLNAYLCIYIYMYNNIPWVFTQLRSFRLGESVARGLRFRLSRGAGGLGLATGGGGAAGGLRGGGGEPRHRRGDPRQAPPGGAFPRERAGTSRPPNTRPAGRRGLGPPARCYFSPFLFGEGSPDEDLGEGERPKKAPGRPGKGGRLVGREGDPKWPGKS